MEQTNDHQQAPSMNEWDAEDLRWLKTVPEYFQPTAKRFGRELFQLVFTAGVIGESLRRCIKWSGGNRKVASAVGVLQQQSHLLISTLVQKAGKGEKDFHDCRGEIERIVSLVQAAQPPSEKRSNSGLILPN